MRRSWTVEIGFFLALWLGLMLVGRSGFFRDPGTFWHTVVGQQMLRSGEVPRQDSLSFTFGGRPWVATQWLAECGMAAIYDALGWDGLLLAAATLLAGLYAWLARRMLAAGAAPVTAAVLIALLLGASAHHFHVRPHLATLVGLGLTLALLTDVEAGRAPLRRLALLPPVLALWANLHGGVLAGWGTLLLVSLGWCAARLLRWESPVQRGRDVLLLAAVVAAGGLALLATPYGLDAPRTWLHVMRLDLPELIDEHAPLDVLSAPGTLTLVLAAVWLTALAGAWRRPRATWLVAAVWLLLAAQRVRHAPLFAVAAGVTIPAMLVAGRWQAWLAAHGWWRAAEAPATSFDWRALRRPALAGAALLAAVVGCQAAGSRAPVIGRGWARLDPQVWPVALAPRLANIARDAPGAPIFNALDLGGFVAFHAPGLRIFVDDRCELFGGEFLRRYVEAERRAPQQIDDWQSQHGFRWAIVQCGSPFDRHLAASPRWRLDAHDEAAALYRLAGD
jgi:hypothetical protein